MWMSVCLQGRKEMAYWFYNLKISTYFSCLNFQDSVSLCSFGAFTWTCSGDMAGLEITGIQQTLLVLRLKVCATTAWPKHFNIRSKNNLLNIFMFIIFWLNLNKYNFRKFYLFLLKFIKTIQLFLSHTDSLMSLCPSGHLSLYL